MKLVIRIIAVFRREVFRRLYKLQYSLGGWKHVDYGQKQVGLGNRLKGLANVYAWEGTERIVLKWGMDDWVPMAFEDLFVMEGAPRFKCHSYHVNVFSRLLLYPFPQGHEQDYWRFYVSPKWADCSGHVDFLYHKTPLSAWKAYRPFFDQLRPSGKVMKRVAECSLPSSYVSVHIRNSFRNNDTKPVCPIEWIAEEMRKYPNDTTFFISCMEQVIADYFRNEFGDRIIELPKKDYYSMVDAVADMWILGQGREIVCSSGSTFTEIAWWWGGNHKKNVTMMKEIYRQPKNVGGAYTPLNG